MTKIGDVVMTHSAWLNTHPKDREYARRIEAAQRLNGYKPYSRTKCSGLLVVCSEPPNALAECTVCFWTTTINQKPVRVVQGEGMDGRLDKVPF